MPINREFTTPGHIEATIREVDSGEVVGSIRIKPSAILWKAKGRHKWKWRSLDKFARWMQKSERDVQK